MKYTEIGFGNPTFISTEIENGSDERRVRGLVRMKVRSLYMRLWIGRSVFILDTHEGFKRTRKNVCAFKALLGVTGE